MRRIYFTAMFTLIACAVMTNQIYAQNQTKTSKTITIVTKTINENGDVEVKKMVLEGDDIKNQIKDLNVEDIQSIDVNVQSAGMTDQEGEMHDIIVKSNGNSEMITIDIDDTNMNLAEIVKIKGAKNLADCKTMVRVIKEGEKFPEALTIDIEADKIDIESGEHHRVVTIVSDRTNDPEKGFMGVVLGEATAKGVVVSSVVRGSGAEKAGIQAGDVLTKVNKKKIKTDSDISEALAGTKPNDAVNVAVLRDGVKVSQFVKLGSANNQRHFTRTKTRTFNDIKQRKINCAALGVYTGVSSSRDGARVIRTIKGSGAEDAGLQANDVIIALDNVKVANYDELHTTIGKYDPGATLSVTYVRNGIEESVDASLTQWIELPEFKEKPMYQQATCEEPEEEVKAEVLTPAIPVDRTLELEDFSVFPNPTYGPVTLNFRGEAVPTVITVTDATGRQVFREDLPKFDGAYNKELQLDRVPTGTLYMNITQGEKTYTETIVISRV